jgi:hypothetical protein
MTYEELLSDIDSDHYRNSRTLDTPYAALRAIVELHKPTEEDGKLWCSHEVCYNHIEFLERNDCDCSYPCQTIQAIEKELK